MVDFRHQIPELMTFCIKFQSFVHTHMERQKASEWRAYLDKHNTKNYVFSFLHHRFNIYFVLGGAEYFHRHQIKEFIATVNTDNFLHTSILSDINKKLYVAAFRALGIFNKLITGPIYRKI